MPADAEQLEITGTEIRLGQLLKLAGLADSGAAAKALLGEGAVAVNGAPESRRGRRLVPGDTVTVADRRLAVVRRD